MKNILVRSAVPTDAQGFLDLWEVLDSETEFMLFEPGERKIAFDEQKKRLERSVDSDNIAMFVLEDPLQAILAGFAAGFRNTNFRDNHKLHLVIGLRQRYTGKGLGSKLLDSIEEWALQRSIRRLELSVIVTNNRAIQLYKRHQFETEGTRKDSVQLKSGFVDEYVMGKLLEMRD
ncbi:MAG: N-acetyltransferase family protein [Granulosicoccus sp.]